MTIYFSFQKKVFKKILSAMIVMISTTLYSYSQDTLKSEKIFEEFLQAMIYENFDFDKPDESFELLESGTGYENKKIKATIKYILLPGSFEKGLKEFREIKDSEETILVDSFLMYTGIEKQKTFTIIQKQFAPADSDHPNFISITVLFYLTDNLTLGIIGAYPESHDKELRKKFMTSALTIKQVNQ